MNAFSRNELASVLAKRFGFKGALAREVVEEVLVQMAAQLAAGRRIEFRGFGVFTPAVRKPKVGRNPNKPAAGDYIIPQRRVVRFRLGRDLDAVLNEPPASPEQV